MNNTNNIQEFYENYKVPKNNNDESCEVSMFILLILERDK